MRNDNPNILGAVELASNPGVSGQVLTSSGPGNQAIWANNNPQNLYLFTDKLAQVMPGAVSDLDWNQPPIDALNGISLDVGNILFNLLPNRTYTLIANIVPSAAATFTIGWVDTANNFVGSINQPSTSTGSMNHIHAFAVLRPLVPTQVKVRKTSAGVVNLTNLCSVFIESVD